MLGLNREQEASGEGINVIKAWDIGDIGVGLGAKVPMGENNEPPDKCKEEPGQDKGEGEYKQRPAPLCVHEGRENILEVSAPALGHVPLDYVAVSVLEDDTFSDTSGSITGLTVSEI